MEVCVDVDNVEWVISVIASRDRRVLRYYCNSKMHSRKEGEQQLQQNEETNILPRRGQEQDAEVVEDSDEEEEM